MPQDQDTGAAANDFGRANAARVAAKIGATLIDPKRSNEASLGGKRTVIKSAKAKTDYVGVPYTLLSRIQSVTAAFEEADGGYIVFQLSAEEFRKAERPRSTDKAAGLVHRKVFIAKGRELGRFTL